MIRFFALKGLKAKEIYEQLLEAYKEFSPSKRRLEDDPRDGRPKTETTLEIIEQVHNIVNEDPSLTKRELKLR